MQMYHSFNEMAIGTGALAQPVSPLSVFNAPYFKLEGRTVDLCTELYGVDEFVGDGRNNRNSPRIVGKGLESEQAEKEGLEYYKPTFQEQKVFAGKMQGGNAYLVGQNWSDAEIKQLSVEQLQECVELPQGWQTKLLG